MLPPSLCSIHVLRYFEHTFFLFSGPPGAGKTTTSFLIAKAKKFVLYEADCHMIGLNPYIDTNGPEVLDAILTQKPLKDLTKERFMDSSNAMKTMKKLAMGQEFDEGEKELVKKLYKNMAQSATALGDETTLEEECL